MSDAPLQSSPVPPSLLVAELEPFWTAVRERIERRDLGAPVSGRVRVGALAPSARMALEALARRPIRATVDLHELEASLARLEVGPTLTEALARLGHAPSRHAAERRSARRVTASAHAAVREEAASWSEAWASEWAEAIVRAGTLRGLDVEAAVRLVRDVRAVIDRLDAFAVETTGAGSSRTDLAAQLFGDAHALDTGTRREAAVTRALALRHDDTDRRSLWARAGAHLDLTSAPALVWNLPLAADSALTPLVRGASSLGVPLHLSQLALREHPLGCRSGAAVLVVENPRVVEAAAQRRAPGAFVCASGNPSRAVQLLVSQLLAGGVLVRCHGDFDAAGLAICARFHSSGIAPWRMGAADYEAALASARDAGVELPHDEGRVPSTPWEPTFRDVYSRYRRVVHEERLLDDLLAWCAEEA